MLTSLGRYEESLNQYQRASEQLMDTVEPGTELDLVLGRSQTLIMMGALKRAEEELQRALISFKKDDYLIIIHEELGDLLSRQEDYEASIVHYKEARKLINISTGKDNIDRLEQKISTSERKLIVYPLWKSITQFLFSEEFHIEHEEPYNQIVAIPKRKLWAHHFASGVCIVIRNPGVRSDKLNYLSSIREYANKYPFKPKHALLITEDELEFGECSMITTLSTAGFHIVHVPKHIFLPESAENSISTMLRSHIDLRLGSDFNPFNETGPVRGAGNFFGRESILNKLEVAMTGNTHNRQAIFGLRKLGKTSLLLHLRTKLNIPTAFVDMQRGTNIESVFNHILADWAVSAHTKFGLDWATPKHSKASIDARENFISAYNELLQKLDEVMEEARLALFIDEVELIVPERDEKGSKLDNYLKLFETIRTLSSSESTKLSIIITSFDPAIVRISHWGKRQNPAYQLFDVNYLDTLQFDDCEHMLRALGAQIDLKFEKDAIELIYEASGGHPFIARQLCSLAISGKDKLSVIKRSRLEKIVDDFIYEQNTASILNEDGLWGAITSPAIWGRDNAKAHADFLCSLAKQKKPVNFGEIQWTGPDRLKQVALRELTSLSILRKSESMGISINIGLFKNWLSEWKA